MLGWEQLDIPSTLTEARFTTVEALRNHEMTKVRLERAVGLTIPQDKSRRRMADSTQTCHPPTQ